MADVRKLQIIGKFPTSDSVLPPVTNQDEGKILKVVDGKWAAAELPTYNGEFTVTPSTSEDQTLLTAQTYLDSNIKIEKVPYAEVSNNSGGSTATIGG